MHAVLGQSISIPQGHRSILHGLVIDRHAERRANLVLTTVATTNRTRLVVLGHHIRPQACMDFAGFLRLTQLAQQRQDRDLDRRQTRMQAQDENGAGPGVMERIDSELVQPVAERSRPRCVPRMLAQPP